MNIYIDGTQIIFFREKRDSGKIAVLDKNHKPIHETAQVFPWNYDCQSWMTDEQVAQLTAERNIEVPVTDQATAVREPGTVGLCTTKNGRYLSYMVDDDGKLYNTAVHDEKREANRRAFQMASILDFYRKLTA